jgi:hypothetical protein
MKWTLELKKGMQFSLLINLLFLSPIYAANISYEQSDSESLDEEHAHVLNPKEERRYYEQAHQKGNFELLNFRFPQEDWRECTDPITGNYSGYNCANRRKISSILKEYMDRFLVSCVQEGLDEIEEGQLDQLHIIHDGILGDRRHSPRSLHAENRAIDISSFKITLFDGNILNLDFKKYGNGLFFKSFRQCWGEAMKAENGCPTYSGRIDRTGSIGKEDRNHQNHMHTSVPHCINGQYGSYYYRR